MCVRTCIMYDVQYIGGLQYIGGCSVRRGVFSTSGGYHEYIGGVQYIGGISWVHQGMFSTLGDTMSTSGYTMSTSGGISWVHQGCSVHRGVIMMHMGEKVGKNLSISIENSNVLNISRCTEHPPMYSWYLPDVLMISPWCIHGIPPCIMVSQMYSWYPSDVLNIPPCTHDIPPMYSWYPPNVLMVSPQCIHGTPRCTEDPPMYWTSPDVLNIPRCTEHTLYRVFTFVSCSWYQWTFAIASSSRHYNPIWRSLGNVISWDIRL